MPAFAVASTWNHGQTVAWRIVSLNLAAGRPPAIAARDRDNRPAFSPAPSAQKECRMSVAKVSEISSTSTKSFEDAVQQGLNRAAQTLRQIRSAWIKEQHVRCDGGRITEYQVNMMVTFVLDD
jgi:flavin-binding protein dodecin